MNWAVPSWGAPADQGPTMVSFSSTSPTTEINIQGFSDGLEGWPARPARAGKRSHVAGSGVPDGCSVDGCRSDMSRCREYYRRHKACEAHSKTPVVVVGGQEQRFCQQCSRFHMLSEFDGRKRSCRKRLDRHNKRRRKAQYHVMNLKGFFPYHQGNKFSICPQSTPRSGQNSDSVHSVDHQDAFSISFSETVKAPDQFTLSQDGGSIPNAFRPNTILPEKDIHARSSSFSGALLGPECALSLQAWSLHHPFPITGQEQQVTSPPLLQDATTSSVAYASCVAHPALARDALFDDPLQAMPFIWQ